MWTEKSRRHFFWSVRSTSNLFEWARVFVTTLWESVDGIVGRVARHFDEPESQTSAFSSPARRNYTTSACKQAFLWISVLAVDTVTRGGKIVEEFESGTGHVSSPFKTRTTKHQRQVTFQTSLAVSV